MIYVTGDTHGQHDFAKMLLFAREHPELTKNDYVIVAGDFGGVYSSKTLEEDLKPYSDLPFTILFVDGNHENFDLLNNYPIEIWNSGKIHRIKPTIIHLMRGQVYEIEGKTIFTFGGATSTDKANRIVNNLGWWEQELPTLEEYDEALINLERYHNKVDYIITHSCSERTLMYPPFRTKYSYQEVFYENKLLSNFEDTVSYQHWYFGHYHLDQDITDKATVLYQEFRRIS